MMKRREFLTSTVAAGSIAGVGLFGTLDEIKPGNVPSLRPPYRLPVDWYRATVKRFQEKISARGLTGAIVSDPLNRNYLTGIFLTETERPNYLFVPASG